MRQRKIDKILDDAILLWGKPAQIGQLHEEIGELLQALNKVNRAKDAQQAEQAYINLIDEYVDLEIMLEQLFRMLPPYIAGEQKHSIYEFRRNCKLERLEKRIEQFKESKKN